jgi:hypothetical protein
MKEYELGRDLSEAEKLEEGFLADQQQMILETLVVARSYHYELSTDEDFEWFLGRLAEEGYIIEFDSLEGLIAHEKAHADVAREFGAFKSYHIKIRLEPGGIKKIQEATTLTSKEIPAYQRQRIALAPWYIGVNSIQQLSDGDLFWAREALVECIVEAKREEFSNDFNKEEIEEVYNMVILELERRSLNRK